MDKRDVVQLKLTYGKALFIVGNINNLDFFINVPSLLKIASFFDLHRATISAPPESYGFAACAEEAPE